MYMSTNKEKENIVWESPSNIALVKYWGKRGNQLPCNPSISMTLKKAVTRTSFEYFPRVNAQVIDFQFEGKENPPFQNRISSFLDKLSNDFAFLKDFSFSISSENTFPHSAGIASSASALSALALCICSMEERLTGISMDKEEFYRKASFISRLGSGSASRSIYGGYAIWGESNAFSKASDEFAVPFSRYIHPVFEDYQDSILLISSAKKSVSSTAGHQLMNSHPYANVRFEQANYHFEQLLGILRSGDLSSFVDVVENEALSLHALMMNSHPSFTLIKPNTLEAIERIRSFRAESKIPLCFTLDAGPNIHLLYPKADVDKVLAFIDSDLVDLLEEGKYILDEKGDGPSQITTE